MPDDLAVGRQIQAVRLARNLRQSDIATRAGVSRTLISRIECGDLDRIAIGKLRAVSRALSMPPLVTCGWRGPEVERLVDRVHASLVELAASRLKAWGWHVLIEYSFSSFGERGSVDILAWHPQSKTLLVIEVKGRIWNIQDTLMTTDRKRRLLPQIVTREIGWPVERVGLLLVLGGGRADRRLIDRHATTFGAALPERGPTVRRWLESPAGDLKGIWFLHNDHRVVTRRRVTRKRARQCTARLRGTG
jgi:transcriptional regulator with XRE-family HTH domain